jgi:hypothetical protein
MLRIRVVSIGPGTKSHVLASCKLELTSEDGTDVVSIIDARVLRNRTGELWIGYHNQAFFEPNGSHRYVPTIEFSRSLTRRISAAVLDAYEAQRGTRQPVETHGR